MSNPQSCFAVAPLTTRVLRDKGIVATDPIPKPLLFDGHAKDVISQRILDAVRDVEYVSLRTSPYEQACALHSTFGTIHNTELFCENARQKAKDILFASRYPNSPSMGSVLHEITCSIARSLAPPSG